MPCTGKLANYKCLGKWFLKNLQLPLYQTSILPNYILNDCPYTYRELYASCFINEDSLCNRENITNYHNQSKWELWSLVLTYTSIKQFPQVRFRENCRRGGRNIVRIRGSESLLLQGPLVISEVTPHKVTPTWLPELEVNKDNSKQVKLTRRKTTRTQSCTKYYNQLINSDNGTNRLPRGTIH